MYIGRDGQRERPVSVGTGTILMAALYGDQSLYPCYSLSACRIARRDDPRRAVDHHRLLAGAACEGGTNRG